MLTHAACNPHRSNASGRTEQSYQAPQITRAVTAEDKPQQQDTYAEESDEHQCAQA